jgi:hypothetical protein
VILAAGKADTFLFINIYAKITNCKGAEAQ